MDKDWQLKYVNKLMIEHNKNKNRFLENVNEFLDSIKTEQEKGIEEAKTDYLVKQLGELEIPKNESI
jgi:hypothetical protein